LGDYLFFSRIGVIGGWTSIGLAHSVLAVPYVFIAVQASLAGLDPALPRAAESMGSGPFALLRFVYWPAIRPGVLAGAIFAFIASFDEVVISLFLAGPNVTTLPVQMFVGLQFDLTPKIAAVSAILFALSLVGLAVQALHQSKAGKMGRVA
jgi:putative spermidine/putrescine transport system permease protein